MRHIRRKKRKLTLKRLILLLILLTLMFLVVSRTYINSPVMVYAKKKSELYASIFINNAISEDVISTIDTSKIIYLETQNNGIVTSVVVDVYQVNLILTKMTTQIQNQLISYENEPNHPLNHLKIPIGVMFDNPVLNGLGPDITIRLRMIGSVKTDIESKVVPYGINNSLIELNILTKVTFQVMIPLQADEFEVVVHTPLFFKIIQGSVPHYYYTGGNGYFSNPPTDTSGNIPDSTLLEQ